MSACLVNNERENDERTTGDNIGDHSFDMGIERDSVSA